MMYHNPFATRFTAPGSVPYLTDAGLCTRLHEAWLNQGRVGAIIGPHGSGKSTLLATLAENWTLEHGYRVTRVALHDGQRTLPESLWQQDLDEHGLLIVDGYEQLGWRARWSLQRLRQRTSCGLLITAHSATRLPTLYRVEPDYRTFLVVVRRLLETVNEGQGNDTFLARHARRAWQTTGGNAREALFGLYDCWEETRVVESPISPRSMTGGTAC